MAVKKKVSWMRSIVPACFGVIQEEQPPCEPKKGFVMKQSSFQRLSFLDLSNPSSTMLSEDLSISLAGSNLHVFTHAELKVVTQNFSPSNFIGEGGFGPVYKGFIDDKLRYGLKAQPVAKLLVHICAGYSVSLPWSARMKIAVGAAKGLAFLHEAEKPVIYRDFKASNILLDSDYTPKLSDFGLAKDGPEGDDTHVSTRVMGTQGYAAPEYIMTGHLTAMSDVYSFGVVLLELLTGRRSVDKSRSHREQNLVEWARPMLNDHRKLSRIMDSRLEGLYSETGARKAAALAYLCLSHRPKQRPTMSSVVKSLESLQDFDDIPIGTFVYTVPSETNLAKEDSTKDSEPKKESKNSHHRHSSHGQRHRRHRSQTINPENVRSSNGLKSPLHPSSRGA
ncbi:hypothetical protein EZV62_013027 [Acer yangbiense]|uniref:Protein kinase domain-containing protein n=1 Tax=Acer yangbiense TaxID=1000413 RepID=A0A5C7HXU7_9ROSI|nr:hypothetical protein EZV62_013027 [Acer yangbiense]